MDRRVVVTGMGAISPLGLSVAELWQGIVAARAASVRSHCSIRRVLIPALPPR